ncbi:MAG: glutamate 5-kinase [Thermoguttaceae bacterium]|nr:glutamate 5-kinase [Thermoguttaceae bacterium]
MVSLSRQEIFQTSEYVVVKVGTNVLTGADGRLNVARINKLVDDLVQIQSRGKKVILVSSGAVGAGMGILGLEKRPAEHPKLQAIAAIGQGKLMQTYEEALARYKKYPAQILLTASDLIHRNRYLNARNTFISLFTYGVLPIVNENDTVSVDELNSTFGDNDRLAALIANLFMEPLLILLTDVDGLYNGDPALESSKLIPLVDRWTPDLMTMVAEKRSGRSKGGMSSKLKAAQILTTAGGSVIIANGDDESTLTRIMNGEEVGTAFFPKGRLLARKRWLGFAAVPKGAVVIDDGAARALLEKGKSLLAVGITRVKGTFEKGDIVAILNLQGGEVARGLTNYSSDELERIHGRSCGDIREILGECPYEEVVHRDNIQLVG